MNSLTSVSDHIREQRNLKSDLATDLNDAGIVMGTICAQQQQQGTIDSLSIVLRIPQP